MKLGYNPTDAQSLLDFALPLTGKTLGDFLTEEEKQRIKENPKNKGDLGTLIERYYFHWNAGNKAEPDFPDAGVELKTAAVVPHRKNRYRAKERLKLTSINYMKLPHEEWADNSLMKKCATLLLLFSLYEQGLPVLKRRFVAKPQLWSFPEKDLPIISKDWQTVVDKIRAGKAHELSGGDTLYLEACTSGASGQMAKQPYSDIPAKTRSFALKSSYINVAVLADTEYAEDMQPILGKGDNPEDFESIVLRRLSRYYGMAVSEIKDTVAPDLSESKHQLARLGYRMLGVTKNHAEEFEKAGIEIKSISLRPNGTPEQDMSFPAFEYMDIVDEEWEDSVFFKKLDRKFLFLIYQQDREGNRTFEKAMFWQIPSEDLEEARRVWEVTKRRVNEKLAHELPLKDFSKVAHVRNHATNSKPENHIDSPFNGKLAKKGFWLNALYIREQIETTKKP